MKADIYIYIIVVVQYNGMYDGCGLCAKMNIL